jgi:hypothetical protein
MTDETEIEASPWAIAMEGHLSGLFDDTDFLEVHRRMSPFNIFEAVGAIRGELRHSNFLGYLLSPSRPHGLGARPLAAFLRRVLSRTAPLRRPIMTLELVVGELDDAIVYRERDSIDILIELPTLQLVVAIENKIGAKAGVGQLERYRKRLKQTYPDHHHLLVFLTPDGMAAEHADYVEYDYADLASTLEDLVSQPQAPVPSETALVVRHYVHMLRRHIVQDDKLQALAVTLYERHKEAFDFIFDSRPAPTSLLTPVRDSVSGVGGLLEDSNLGSIFRFAPEVWDERLAAIKGDPAKWSKTGRGLLFEAKTYAGTPGRVNISLILGPGDPATRVQVYQAAVSRPEMFTGLVKPMGAQWVTLFSRDLLTANQAKGLSFEAQATSVGLAWGDFQGRKLQALIDAILEIDANIITAAS